MTLFFGHYRKTKANKYLLSLSLPSSVFKPSPRHRPVPLFMHLPRLLAGLSVRGKGGFIFFSFFLLFFCTISCLQKPLMPIQHQHQGTALMSILATAFFLSPLPAALSPSLSLYILLLYPHLIPSLTLYGYTTIT